MGRAREGWWGGGSRVDQGRRGVEEDPFTGGGSHLWWSRRKHPWWQGGGMEADEIGEKAGGG